MTLGKLSREELSAGCSGRAEKPNKGMPLGSLGSRLALHFWKSHRKKSFAVSP